MRKYFVTALDRLIGKSGHTYLRPLIVELSCCAPGIGSALSRDEEKIFSGEDYAVSPRHADLLLVAGTVSLKMAPEIRSLYELMPEPKYVVAFGNCAVSGGPYWQYGYHVLKGIDQVVRWIYIYPDARRHSMRFSKVFQAWRGGISLLMILPGRGRTDTVSFMNPRYPAAKHCCLLLFLKKYVIPRPAVYSW